MGRNHDQWQCTSPQHLHTTITITNTAPVTMLGRPKRPCLHTHSDTRCPPGDRGGGSPAVHHQCIAAGQLGTPHKSTQGFTTHPRPGGTLGPRRLPPSQTSLHRLRLHPKQLGLRTLGVAQPARRARAQPRLSQLAIGVSPPVRQSTRAAVHPCGSPPVRPAPSLVQNTVACMPDAQQSQYPNGAAQGSDGTMHHPPTLPLGAGCCPTSTSTTSTIHYYHCPTPPPSVKCTVDVCMIIMPRHLQQLRVQHGESIPPPHTRTRTQSRTPHSHGLPCAAGPGGSWPSPKTTFEPSQQTIPQAPSQQTKPQRYDRRPLRLQKAARRPGHPGAKTGWTPRPRPPSPC